MQVETNLQDVLKRAGFKSNQALQDIGVLFEPRPHQLTGLNKCLKNERYGVYDDPGTGKSLIAYLYSEVLKAGGKKVLCLMPPALSEQYARKYHEMLVGSDAVCFVMNGKPKEREESYEGFRNGEWPDTLIYSYQMFLRDYDKVDTSQYALLCCDESHALKNPSAKIFKLVAKVLASNEDIRLLLMTGTPIVTTPEDAYGNIKLTNPTAYRTKKSFERKHCVKMWENGFWITRGYKNLNILSKNLYENGRRIIKEDVLDISKPNVIELQTSLSDSHKKLYKKLMEERVLEIPKESSPDGTEFINAIQSAALRRHAYSIINFPQAYTTTKIVNNVQDLIKAQLESINLNENKVMLFANYTATVEGLVESLKEYNPAVIYGKSNTEQNKIKFIEDDTCRVCVLNPLAGGVGLDGLQTVCSDVMFVEPCTSPGLFDQAASRLVRSGQTKVVNVYTIKVSGTLYSHASRTLSDRTSYVKETIVSVGGILNELLDIE